MLRPMEGIPEIMLKEAAWLCVAFFRKMNRSGNARANI
jgi:hypothetical protein